MKKIKLFHDPFQKTKHILTLIANNMRKIDYLRVHQIMNRMKCLNRRNLIDICTNKELLIQQIQTIQNEIHQMVQEQCRKIIIDIEAKSKEQKEQNEQKEEKKNDGDNDENNENNDGINIDYVEVENLDIDNNNTISQQSQIPIEIPINFNKTLLQIRNQQEQKQTQDSFDLVEVTDEIKDALLESWHDSEYSHLQTFQYDGPDFSTKNGFTTTQLKQQHMQILIYNFEERTSLLILHNAQNQQQTIISDCVLVVHQLTKRRVSLIL